MPTLRIRFPSGRYHATPWGHHVNEGHIEWPPSPWRLLRALVACGFTTQQWHEISPVARQLIEKLSATLPVYRLPTASAAHSRHFMPIGSLDKGRERTTLVFDTWADVGGDELLVRWDCELTDEETELLGVLAGCLGYLGRSESWVEAELIADNALAPEDFNAFPQQNGFRPGPECEQVSLMAAIPAHEYLAWQRDTTDRILAEFPLPEGKKKLPAKLLRDRTKAVAAYPTDLLDCLTKDTSWWKAHCWSQPPGSQRVIYQRCDAALQMGVPRQRRTLAAKPVTTMLLALTTPSGSKSALPPCHRTLPQAERFHDQLVRQLGKGRPVDCPEITGRDCDGRPLHDRHRHAHILPIDLDDDGHLDHLLIHAPMGLKEQAQHAIRSVDHTYMKGGAGKLQVTIAGSGNLNMLYSLRIPVKRRITQLLGPSEGARVWVSLTPFVPPRFLKRRGTNDLTGQINAELASRDLPPAQHVEDVSRHARFRALRHFVRSRQRGGAPPPVDFGFALRLHFADPLFGSEWKDKDRRLLALGYASHFGLGVFVEETQ
ncbi:MAG TPA: type I-U CRISPR-associated protein Csb2 [Pirellulales bacterium]|nr:type I-U CRISPR-associated protein Csb2 [Pirellulales bacterium]